MLLSLRRKTIAVTRPKEQARQLAAVIKKLGGKPYIAPTIEIKTGNGSQIKKFIRKVFDYQIDCVIFMSRNAVNIVIKAAENLRLKSDFIAALNRVSIIAIGPKTKGKLEHYGVKVDLTPSEYSSEGIVRCLRGIDLRRMTIAIPRMDRPDPYLRRELEMMGAEIIEIPTYESTIPSDRSGILKLLEDLFKGKIHVITFTSSATARNLFQVASQHSLDCKLQDSLGKKAIVAAIGPVTQRTLEQLRVRVDVKPKEYTIEAMIEALIHHINNNGPFSPLSFGGSSRRS